MSAYLAALFWLLFALGLFCVFMGFRYANYAKRHADEAVKWANEAAEMKRPA